MVDGTHDGVRWWLQRFEGQPHPVVTISGYDGACYVYQQAELRDATPAGVQAWLEKALAAKRAKRERQAAAAPQPAPAATPAPAKAVPAAPGARPWAGRFQQQSRPQVARAGQIGRLL